MYTVYVGSSMAIFCPDARVLTVQWTRQNKRTSWKVCGIASCCCYFIIYGLNEAWIALVFIGLKYIYILSCLLIIIVYIFNSAVYSLIMLTLYLLISVLIRWRCILMAEFSSVLIAHVYIRIKNWYYVKTIGTSTSVLDLYNNK